MAIPFDPNADFFTMTAEPKAEPVKNGQVKAKIAAATLPSAEEFEDAARAADLEIHVYEDETAAAASDHSPAPRHSIRGAREARAAVAAAKERERRQLEEQSKPILFKSEAPTILLPGAPEPMPTLPDEFWSARPRLSNIRQMAYALTLSGDAVLYSALARMSAGVPHQLKLPPIIGADAPFNVLAGLVGAPGNSKSTSYRGSAKVIDLDPDIVRELPPGSGEGLVEALFEYLPNPDGSKGKIHVQTRYNGLVYFDEAEVMTAIADRQNSTLMGNLRSIFSGSMLGQGNASAERRRVIPAGQYSYGVVLAIQPKMGAKILAGEDAGTPQRFLWGSALDSNIPAEDVPMPKYMPLRPLDLLAYIREEKSTQDRVYMNVAESIQAEIKLAHRMKHWGTSTEGAMQAHTRLVRLKVGGLLAILDSRPESLTEEDWQLATVITDTSDKVLSYIERAVAEVEAREERKTKSKVVGRAVAVAEGLETLKLTKVAMRITEMVANKPGTSRTEMYNNLSKGQREDLDAAIAYAISKGWIVERAETVSRAGRGNVAKRGFFPGAER